MSELSQHSHPDYLDNMNLHIPFSLYLFLLAQNRPVQADPVFPNI